MELLSLGPVISLPVCSHVRQTRDVRVKFQFQELKRKDLGVRGRVMLIPIRNRVPGCRMRVVAGCCEHGNEPSG
jgi:hypothetical protein